MLLTPYATRACDSRGRRHPQPAAPLGDAFEEDRDRIVHCAAFRRLVYKTQVFANHEGDLFRTRLTHSLEVAQCGRVLARALGLNEVLVECLALAHDLGHTPFGHAGQDALASCMAAHGGFEHNLQTLRTVDRLERVYPDFDGLNLSFELREGLLKRCSIEDAAAMERDEPGGPAARFVDGSARQASLEAQVANHADEIAYDLHDVDDGVRAGLLDLGELREVELLGDALDQAVRAHPGLVGAAPRRMLTAALRALRQRLLQDLIETSRRALQDAAPSDPHIARLGAPLIGFSAPIRQAASALKRALFAGLYRHPQVSATMAVAARVVTELFGAYQSRPQEMPAEYRERGDQARAVADYVAGMTDRFALLEYQRMFGRTAFG